MKRQQIINLILFLLLGCVTIIASKGGFTNSTLSDFAFNIGISMVGGLICGVALYGIDFIKTERQEKNNHFVHFKKNKDMGQKYWIDFLRPIDKNPNKLWFVGNRHLTWIDKNFAFRNEIKKKFINRINRSIQDHNNQGWEIIIMLTDENAFKGWKEFIYNEIAVVTQYIQKKPSLIKIGLVTDQSVHYSIVAHGGGTVITSYTSTGKAAESPTFEIRPNSEAALLYNEDLERIKSNVEKNNWWDNSL